MPANSRWDLIPRLRVKLIKQLRSLVLMMSVSIRAGDGVEIHRRLD